LQALLETILGSRNVYFQPPESVKMNYPAIVYSLDDVYGHSADDFDYIAVRGYSVTLITKDPDSEYIDSIKALPLCSYDRHYYADNLNHDTFTIYY